jgi:hypothetical protein
MNTEGQICEFVDGKGGTISIPSKIGITIILSLGIVLLIGRSSAASQGQKPAWKGKIVTENGVKVVKNPKDPFYGEIKLDLQEDLSIGGNENEDKYYFPKGVFIAVDDQGNIFAADMGNFRIQKYDKAGKYLRSIGRKGQGPAEFQSWGTVGFDAEGNISIITPLTRALKVFSPDGTYKKSVTLRASLQPSFYLSKEGFIFGLEINYMAKDGPRIAVIKLNPDGSSAETLARFQGELKPNQPAYAFHAYTNSIVLCGLSPAAFCYGFSSDYKIFIADGQGKTSLIIEKEENPQPITAKEKEFIFKKGTASVIGRIARTKIEKIEDAAVFPPHRPYFGKILADDAGRIYVTKRSSVLDQSKVQEFDVFSKDGIFLYRAKLPFIPEIIKAGSIYEIRKNEETGDIKIVRHKVKNWKQIKDRI